jgi:hypothetical protein
MEASGDLVGMAIGSADGTLSSAELCAASPYGDPIDFAQAGGDVDAVEAASIAARAAAVRADPELGEEALLLFNKYASSCASFAVTVVGMLSTTEAADDELWDECMAFLWELSAT